MGRTAPAHRRAHGDELKPIVAAWMKAHTRAEVVEIMKQVPLGVIRTPEQVLEAPEFAARGFLQSLQVGSHQGAAPGLPFVLSRTPSRIAGAAPRVGEHTRRVLMEELGLSGEKVAELHASSVI